MAKSSEIKIYTLPETAELLKISKPTLYKYVQSREIAGVKFGRDWRFTEESINAFIKKRTVEAK